MNDCRIEGIGTIGGGEYDSVILSGIVKGDRDITANYLKVEGVFTHKASLTVLNEAHLKGTVSVTGNFRTSGLKSEGIVKIKDGALIADEINAEGMFTCVGEVFVNKSMKTDGILTADKISGGKIEIKTSDAGAKYIQAPTKWIDSITSGIFGQNVSIQHSTVKEIECGELKATRLECDVIHADSVELKDNCIVGRLYCEGSVQIDKTCIVREIIGTQPENFTPNAENEKTNNYTENNKSDSKMYKTEEIKVTQNMRDDILNILNMFKDNAVDADKAVDMIAASAYVSSMQRAARTNEGGFDVDVDWKDDDKLHIAAFIGHKFIKKGIFNSITNEYTVKLEGDAQIRDVECRGHLICGDVGGNVTAGSAVQAGNVEGNASAGSSVTCGNVGRNVSAGASVKCGTVAGNVSAGGGVKIN